MTDINQLNKKRVLLRCDFDVPVKEGKITENFRIKKQKETINFLLENKATIVILAHISAIHSFESILTQIEKVLGHEIKFLKETRFDQLDQLNLLDNIRRWPEEAENKEDFARRLSEGFDIYINNDFAVSHRNHASISGVVKFLPSYAGLLIEEETNQLQKAANFPKEGKIIIIGGAKTESKVPVIKKFLEKSEKIILGGVVANDVFKERGMDIDGSVADKNSKELLTGIDIYDERLVLADDFNAPGGKILDIGEKSIKKFGDLITQAKMVIWNGPMGLFENPDYSAGTDGIVKSLTDSKCHKIIGGGDTISAVDKLGLLDKFDPSVNSGQAFVSTGGGAMLTFLAGDKLPGLEALGYYE
ncbi:MAG: phosphoglycerate kinase [bacterium]|nr:phosphoglycerate kinase [bacterium]